MNVQRAEKAIHVLSVVGVWLSFFIVWGSTTGYEKQLLAHGADLPGPTLLWLAIAPHWATFVIPAICTIVVLYCLRSRSRHSNWVAGAVLCVGLFYAIAAHAAAILPSFTLCGPV